MIRLLFGFPILLIAVVLGGLYAAYGEVDPCRALSVEEARRTERALGLPVESGLEQWSRFGTSQMSTGRCARELIHSWGERLNNEVE